MAVYVHIHDNKGMVVVMACSPISDTLNKREIQRHMTHCCVLPSDRYSLFMTSPWFWVEDICSSEVLIGADCKLGAKICSGCRETYLRATILCFDPNGQQMQFLHTMHS